MKSEFGRLPFFVGICFFVSMACVTLCLSVEYHFFRQQVQELVQLRNYYQTCIQVLKRQISYSEYKGCQDPVLEKKPQTETGQRFLVVNREPEYLKREALKFARSHNLERPLLTLYEKPAEKNPIKKPISVQKGRARACLRAIAKQPKKIAIPKAPINKSKQRKGKIKKTCAVHHVPVGEYSAKAAQLKKESFFAWPIDQTSFWLSSPFGPRKNPNGSMGFHGGTDLAAVRGTPVKACAAGIISQALYHKGYGNMILMACPGERPRAKIRYAHLDSMRVRVGQQVKRGDIIGTVGNTGNVRRKRGRDGSHLHLEIYVSDGHKTFKRVDPLYFLN